MTAIMNRCRATSTSLALVVAVLVVAVLGAPTSIVAASSSGGEPSITDITVLWANFLVYVVLLAVLVKKPIASGWVARRTRIQETVASSTAEVESAERELNAIEALSRTITSEQERARNEIIMQAQVEAESIAKQATERASRIRAGARELLAGEARSAESSFRAALVQRAVTLAREKFSRGEFAGRQQAYIESAVGRAKRLSQ